jgi:phage tail protein X
MVSYLTRDGDMLDWICWRHYGAREGAVELVLDANPGLAARPIVLDAGVTIVLPELPSPSPQPLVRLWD